MAVATLPDAAPRPARPPRGDRLSCRSLAPAQHEYIAHHRTALMQHWHSVLPGRILDVDYENVVADPPAAARRMAEFCGVDHEPAMTEIERSSDPVATASSVLVRDGIRRDRGRLWEPYAPWLRPLIEAFGG